MGNSETLAFGPVPSRRLGKSLGINNIPAKNCPYSCVYCQLGTAISRSINRYSFYEPKVILQAVINQVDEALTRNEQIDFITFVPDGEPTLDKNLEREIALLTRTIKDTPIAVITNSSLLWREDVRESLLEADFVSVKVDAVNEKTWKRINRPHTELNLNVILEGVVEFAEEFKGTIVSETMLIDNFNYNEEFWNIAEFLNSLKNLDRAYIAIPTRPTAEKWVKIPGEKVVNRAYQEFSEILGREKVEYLIGYEGNAFAFTGNVETDLLSITAVHPMREKAVKKLLKKANARWQVIEQLLREKKIIELDFEGKKYYMRKLATRQK